MKTLYAMRHAKSSWSDPYQPDFDRPLARRGVKAARDIARVLDQIDPRPTLVLCSTAARATQTYEEIAGHLGYAISASFLTELYGADSATLLNVLRRVPSYVGSLLLIAHNPGLQELLVELAEDDDNEAARQVRSRFPTAALATLRVGEEWSNLGPATTQITDVVLPRELEDRTAADDGEGVG